MEVGEISSKFHLQLLFADSDDGIVRNVHDITLSAGIDARVDHSYGRFDLTTLIYNDENL